MTQAPEVGAVQAPGAVTFRVMKDVMVPMRDGVRLATDVWVPDGEPAPTLLVRIPYSKDVPLLYGATIVPLPWALLEAGYAVVIQDTRGTFRSEGRFDPMTDEPSDGVDTIAWLRDQPWCDGSIGTYGPSYLGFVQWASASEAPDGLKAIAPALTSTDYYTAPWYSVGGAMSWHLCHFWTTLMALGEGQRSLAAGTGDPQAFGALVGAMADPMPQLTALPAGNQPLLQEQTSWWSQWLEHPARDRYWQDLAIGERARRVRTPALNIGGWFDIFADNTVRTFTQMKQNAGSAEAREGQRLIVGPWDHMSYTGMYRERQFGMTADAVASDLSGAYVRFFDRWLRDRDHALDGDAPVRIFVMGIDQWRDEQDWPLPDTRYTNYFLSGGGSANTAEGNGVLDAKAPTDEATDSFRYDPRDPVPSVGGRLLLPSVVNGAGPADQRPVEARRDVLCFTTPVLEDPVEVTGNVSMVLHVASSALDTDFTGKLVDVHPDGRALYLTDGILRARYRNSLAEPEMLEPDQVYEITVDLGPTSNVFLPGHRIRLEVSSSNFPRYDRNTNTGRTISQDGPDQVVVATNRVLHGPVHPSRLVLPIINR